MNKCYNFYFEDDNIRVSKRTDDSVFLYNYGEPFTFTKEEIVEILEGEDISYPEHEHEWKKVCEVLAFDFCG